ncbi:MAG: glycosyltransferase family 39 protein [Opitutaceae bacterium]|nr:glycosyltransferase family 39 protein [Opitutaceae bacterium]
MSNPNPPADRRPARIVGAGLGILALLLYGGWLAANFSPFAGGADSSGYLNSARLLAAGRLTAEARVPAELASAPSLPPQLFQPHGFIPAVEPGRLAPTYAVGLPLQLALASLVVGPALAPTVVGVLGALAALALLYAVARELGLDAGFAAAGAATLAAFPVFLFMSIQPLSDTPATAWCLAAVFAALRAARGGGGWAVLCGGAIGMAVLVRATNALVLPAIIALLGFDVRRLSLAVLGGLPAAVWLGCYNHALYGSALQSGYLNLGEAFDARYGAPTIVHVAKWIALMMPAALLALPFVALAGRARPARIGIALALWFGAFAGFYAFYEFTREVWWGLRFLLPGLPALILGALLGLETLAKSPRWRGTLAAGLAVWAVGLGWFWTQHHHLLLTRSYEQAYADAADAARREFPRDALVLAGLHSGSLFHSTDLAILRWEFVRPEEWPRLRALAAQAGRPVGAVIFEMEKAEALEQRCTGPWRQLAQVRNIGLWLLDEPREPAPTR